MTTSELMRAMSDAGAPFEAILIAVSALEAKDAEIAARDKDVIERRKRDADRKRGERAVRRESKERPRTVQGQSKDPSPNESILTPTRKKPTKPNGLEPLPKKHRLPVDWEPMPFKPGSLAALTIIRWEPGRMERELSKFRDHHTAAGSRFEVWQAAWSKWVNGSEDFQRGPQNGQSRQPANGLRGHRPDPALDLYRAAVAAEERENREANLGTGFALPAIGSGGP